MGMHQMLGPSFGSGADYEIQRSLRFNSGDSSYLDRTPSSAGNRKTWTWSGWVKRCGNNNFETIFSAGGSNTGFRTNITVFFYQDDDATHPARLVVGEGNGAYLRTNAMFRDPAAWGHLVIVTDTTLSTAADRIKIYWNGVRITDFSADTLSSNVPQNSDIGYNTTDRHAIGSKSYNSGLSQYASLYLAEIHFVDGQALSPSSFGEFDDDNNWNPIKANVTYGTNGYYLNFSDNSSNSALGTDSSGNSNTWTVNNLTAVVPVLNGVSFDGSGDKLVVADDADLAFGTGEFTVEMYFICDTVSGNDVLYDSRAATGNPSDGFSIVRNGNQLRTYTSGNYAVTSSTTLNTGQLYHLAVTRESTTQKMYLDGTLVGSTTVNNDFSQQKATIGSDVNGNESWDGFISNVRLVKGTAVYTANFTAPSTALTNVTNTVLLCCQSSSSTTAATVAPGAITASGDVAVATAYPGLSPDNVDSLIDTPTNYEADSGNNGGNYCTLSPLKNSQTLSNGNLDVVGGSSWQRSVGTIGMYSGKYYWEYTITASNEHIIGVGPPDMQLSGNLGAGSPPGSGYGTELGYVNGTGANGSWSNTGASGAGDVIAIAFDADNGSMYVYKNGTALNSGAASHTGLVMPQIPVVSLNGSSRSGNINFGQRPFKYTPPTGYVSLCTTNLPDPAIADGSAYFDAKLYTGNGSTQSVSLNFGPDLLWLKSRSASKLHALCDSVRGDGKLIYSSSTLAEQDIGASVVDLTSSGFNLGFNSSFTQVSHNHNGESLVGWAWDAGSSTASNSDGSITSYVRVNQSTGFSIATYTGNGTVNSTVGHGLNAAPSLVIIKNRSNAYGWAVLHTSAGTTGTTLDGSAEYYMLQLDSDAARNNFTNDNIWNPTNSTFKINGSGTANWVNANGDYYVAYSWAPVEGFSAFGSYAGNSSSDGPFVFTGFRPKFLVVKVYDQADHWVMWDSVRGSTNVNKLPLYPNLTNSESSNISRQVDLLSNGFKLRATDNSINGSHNYVYMAFAEHPFKTARAR